MRGAGRGGEGSAARPAAAPGGAVPGPLPRGPAVLGGWGRPGSARGSGRGRGRGLAGPEPPLVARGRVPGADWLPRGVPAAGAPTAPFIARRRRRRERRGRGAMSCGE